MNIAADSWTKFNWLGAERIYSPAPVSIGWDYPGGIFLAFPLSFFVLGKGWGGEGGMR